MCGIVAVLSRPSSRPAADVADARSEMGEATALVAAGAAGLRGAPPHPTAGGEAGAEQDPAERALQAFAEAARRLEALDATLRGVTGLACLLAPGAVEAVEAGAAELGRTLDGLEADLDAGNLHLAASMLEDVNAVLVRLRDVWWAIGRDRVGSARSVASLAPPGVDVAGGPDHVREALWALDVACSSLDRLEVRGRDSAGVHILVVDHGVDLAAPAMQALMGVRLADPLFGSLAVRSPGGALSFVYKAAAEIGDLGDNVAALRDAIRNDALLGAALTRPGRRPRVTV
ncbi:MAG: hypothetical protein ACYDEN_05755, partial [Acidimicrobiales bacterium]